MNHAFVRRLTQSNIQALSVPGPGGADQLLSRLAAQRVEPADHRVATTQAQGFASQLLGALGAPGLQQQNALAVKAGISQPGLSQAGGWRDQCQPACVLVLAQFPEDRCQKAQAVPGCTTQ
ncbi:hypothetical protein D3C79_861260 [compost metagenome]